MTRQQLIPRILRFVGTLGTSESFDDLALAIHHHQHANDAVARALTPQPAITSEAIPAVPVALFRDLPVGTVDPDQAHVWFQTSGTTSGRSGVHRMWDTQTYDAGCLAWARRFLPDTRRTFALITAEPHSSLGHMVRGFSASHGPTTFVTDHETIVTHLTEHPNEPVFLCTTAFALDHWLSQNPPPLPPGSAILTTGGFKGRKHERDAEALIDAASRVAPVILEYGMTELSSQLWARPGEPYAPPPWLRVHGIDPLTGSRVAAGQLGQLCFTDLCNVDSAVRIETLDQGVVHADGRLTLHGRLPDAPLRGCSLTAEDLL